MFKYVIGAALLALTACGGTTDVTVKPQLQPTSGPMYIAANVWVEEDDIILDGEITHETDDAVARAIAMGYDDILFIYDSPGGYVMPAHAIGRMVRRNGMATGLLGSCASACVDVFAGGVYRMAGKEAALGIHASTNPNATNSHDRVFFAEMGISPQLVAWQNSIPNNDMYWLSATEAYNLGLVNDFVY